ncbi:MAG: response regulator [Chlorobi bacterium]|nr:response regulator [Chlorobiota bacterium]
MGKNNEKKILIVDDVARNIQILGNILSGNGYQIAYAQNGRQAIKIAMSQDFDLILLDIMMPDMDGYKVCSLLKNNDTTASVPIIFLTAKADMDSIVKGFEIGGQDYITKPFNSAELLARVKTQIQLKTQKQQLKESNVILEQKVNERTQELQKANKMLEKLDKTKSDFLSIISHELRTPLNGIVGLTNLLSTTAMDSSQNEYIEHLKEVSQRLVRFSDMALLITSLKVNQYKPDFLAVSVNHLAKAAIKEFNRLHEDLDLKVKLTTNDDKPLIFADSDLIKQVFILIIENAIKYAGNTEPLDITIKVESNKVIIEFKDSGPGFSDDALAHVFELFGAGDILHVEGTGLSLAAVKLIMDMHNGKVEINNSREKGALLLFKFDLIEG